MSGRLYGYVYIPSPEQLAKLEAERRRREAEQRLQIEIEKTKVVVERLNKEREERKAKEKEARRVREEEERRWHLEKELFKDKPIIKKNRERETLSQKIKESAEKEAEAFSKLQSVELNISELEPTLAELIKTDLLDIKVSLNKIKKKIHGNYSYFENHLKWLDIRLKEIIKKGKDKLEAMQNELDKLTKKAIELLTDIEMIVNLRIFPDKGRGLELKAKLETAMSGQDIDKIKTVIVTLTPEVKKLYNQYIEMEKLNDERQYIMESVQNVITEMGYNVSKLPYTTDEDSQAPIFSEANIPGGEGVRLGFGMGKDLFAEVFHSETEEGVDKEKFKAQEKKWCSDIDRIKTKLNEKGIMFEEKWRKDFTDEDVETILAESRFKDSPNEEEYRRRMIQEPRRMQK